MEVRDYPDNELILLAKENNEYAKDLAVEKYKYIVDIITKKYYNITNILGVESNDLYQEAYIGLIDGINCFDDKKEASITTFISLCIERRIVNYIKKAGRMKNKILSDAWSLEHNYQQFSQPLMYILGDNNENNPLDNSIKEEDYIELNKLIRQELSDSEYEVFSLMINGLNYKDIASLLDKSPKQIDNSMQRIKNKIKTIINKNTCN